MPPKLPTKVRCSFGGGSSPYFESEHISYCFKGALAIKYIIGREKQGVIDLAIQTFAGSVI